MDELPPIPSQHIHRNPKSICAQGTTLRRHRPYWPCHPPIVPNGNFSPPDHKGSSLPPTSSPRGFFQPRTYVRHASTRSQEHAGCTEFVCNHPSYVSSDNRPASRGAFRPRACYSLGRFGPSPLTTEGTQMPCVSLYPSFPSRRHMRWKPVSTRLTFLGGHKVWRDMTNAPSPPPLVCPFTCSSCCRCRRCHRFTAPAVYTLSSLIMYPY